MLPSDMLNKARLMMEAKRFDNARECVAFVLLHFPQLHQARLMRAEIDFETGARELIDDDIAQCLSINPGYAEALVLKAKRLGESDGSPEAVAELIIRAASLAPSNTYVVKMMRDHNLIPSLDDGSLGFSYLRSGWHELATKSFRQGLSNGSPYLEVRQAYAESLWLEGEHEESLRQCRLVLDHLPSALKPALLIAHMLAETGRVSEGQELLQRTFEVDPECLEAREMFRRSEVTRLQIPVPEMLPAGGGLLLEQMRSSPQELQVTTIEGSVNGPKDVSPEHDNQAQETSTTVGSDLDKTVLFEPVVKLRVDSGERLNPDGEIGFDLGLGEKIDSLRAPASRDIESVSDQGDESLETGAMLEHQHDLVIGDVVPRVDRSGTSKDELPNEYSVEFMDTITQGKFDEVGTFLNTRGTTDFQLVDFVFNELLATNESVSPEMWQLFGDYYMRRSQPDLAYQAYGKVING